MRKAYPCAYKVSNALCLTTKTVVILVAEDYGSTLLSDMALYIHFFSLAK